MNINFTKVTASGNDFLLLDNRENRLGDKISDFGNFAKFSCKRKYSVGADGLLVLEDCKKADFKMRIFNPDGKEVAMCGNGIRCSAVYAYRKGWCGSSMKIETTSGILEAEVNPSLSASKNFSVIRKGGVKSESVRTKMTPPKDIKLDRSIGVGKTIMNVHTINTGVPHVIHFVENIEGYPVKETGEKIRYHKIFEPEGTNVDFVEPIDKSTISVRTYERGVEDETLACGTGVVASAIISHLVKRVGEPLNAVTRSKEILKIYFKKEHSRFCDVCLEGKANIIFEGGMDYV